MLHQGTVYDRKPESMSENVELKMSVLGPLSFGHYIDATKEEASNTRPRSLLYNDHSLRVLNGA